MNYVDVKVTIWNRIEFNDDADMQEVIKTIQEVGLDAACNDDLGFKECSTLYDSEEQIEPKENEGNATIEVYQRDKRIWSNEGKIQEA